MNIESFKDNDERILWKGKPVKSVYLKEQIFSPLLIIAIIWLILDLGIICGIFASHGIFQGEYFLIPFFILHLMPVWLYLAKVLFAIKRWNNIEYMVTDKAVYSLSGVFTTSCDRKTFQEITNTSLHQGIFDKQHDVGDVFITTGYRENNRGQSIRCGINIVDIEDYMKVYKLINKTGTDIFSDTRYPNDLRPKENHGYNTKYKE